MMEKCCDIGTIQAFLDGELIAEDSARVSDHIAACDACSAALAAAEEESAMVFTALDRELNTLVPTQRLWSKISDSIEIENERTSMWSKLAAFAALPFSGSYAATAAGLVVVVGLFAGIMSISSDRAPETASVDQPPASATFSSAQQSAPVAAADAEQSPVTQTNPEAYAAATRPRPAAVAVKASFNAEPARRPARTPETRRADPATPVAAYLPGEESYIRTIANLSESVSEQKDTVLRPSQRVAYERDMAVVNDAIARMRNEVRRNPKNESAKQVLYSSYQNKIDLLNSVSQREELIASIK